MTRAPKRRVFPRGKIVIESGACSAGWYPYARPVLAALIASPAEPAALISLVRRDGVMGETARQALAYLEELGLAYHDGKLWYAARGAALAVLRESALRLDPGASLPPDGS